ncbi:hypothetical protein V5098_18310 [Vibrio coralliirubri]|uniref:hypothetical protein n=1 Tax=Vibrio coralliirubri TaxID=1516159 RepID=UPI002FD53ECF
MSKVIATHSELDKATQLFDDFLAGMPEISINTAHTDAPNSININDNEEVQAYLKYSFSQYLDSITQPDTQHEPELKPHTQVLLTLDESGYPITAVTDGDSELEILIWDDDYDGIVDHVLPKPDGGCGILTNQYTTKDVVAIEWASAIMDVNLNGFEFECTTISLLSENEIKIEQTGAAPKTEIIHASSENAINMLHAIEQEFKYIHGHA